MKRIGMLVTLLLAGLVALPLRAYAWPEAVEAFTAGLAQHDAAAVLRVLAPDATLTVPLDLFPASSPLRAGVWPDPNGNITLAGKAQIAAGLADLLSAANGLDFAFQDGPATLAVG